MGLSIHYRGKFNQDASLSSMINEVVDFAEACKWEYQIYKKKFPENNDKLSKLRDEIYGISFTPQKCETVSICFLSNRKMSSPANLKFYGVTNNKKYREYLYMLAIKTQFAGEEIHKFIIELFKYLEKQGYFENLEIEDEGKYWETGDENLLHNIFKKHVSLLDDFTLALESLPKKQKESFEKYFKRIMDMIIKKNHKSL